MKILFEDAVINKLEGKKLFRKLFWSGLLIFVPSWAIANGLLFLPSSSSIDTIILVLSFIELVGITLFIGGLLFEFEFQTRWKKIVAFGVVILLVGYWIVPFIINLFYPQFISLDFIRQLFLPPLVIRLIPAFTEIFGTLVILSGVFFGSKNETEKVVQSRWGP
ncbi:MAG: hypothetical protein QXV37_02280 [Candidatus Jordarchaeaceae archaeon]